MAAAFFSYTTRDPVVSRLIVERMTACFRDKVDIHDWEVNPISPGDRLRRRISEQLDATSIFIPIICDQYKDKIAGWEFDTWLKSWDDDSKLIIPLFIRAEGETFWKDFCARSNSRVPLSDVAYSRMYGYAIVGNVQGSQQLTPNAISDIDRACDNAIDWVESRRPANCQQQKKATFVLGGLYEPLSSAVSKDRASLAASLGGENVVDLGDKWARTDATPEQRKLMTEYRTGNNTYIAVPEAAVIGSLVDNTGTMFERILVDEIANKISYQAGSAGKPPSVFVWFRSSEPDPFPEATSSVTPLKGGIADVQSLIQATLGTDEHAEIIFEDPGLENLARWFAQHLPENILDKDIPHASAGSFWSFNTLQQFLSGKGKERSIVLALVDKGVSTSSLPSEKLIKRDILGRINDCEEMIERSHHGDSVFRILLNYNYPGVFPDRLYSSSGVWNMLPVSRRDPMEFNKSHVEEIRKNLSSWIRGG